MAISEQESEEVEGETSRNSWVQSIESMREELVSRIEKLEYRCIGLSK